MYIGTIERSEGSSIEHCEWVDLIGKLDFLEPMDAFPVTNPFTGKAVDFGARIDIGVIFKSQVRVGSIDWAPDESKTLIVDASDNQLDYVKEYAIRVAEKLGAKFIFDPIYESGA